jgi:hypothetical protein
MWEIPESKLEKVSLIDFKLHNAELKFTCTSVCNKSHDRKKNDNSTNVGKNHITANERGLCQLSPWAFIKDMLTVHSKDTIIFNKIKCYSHLNISI